MAQRTLITTVTGLLFTAKYGLEGKEIGLSYDGDVTRRSTDRVDINGDLGVFLQVTGVVGTDWSLEIACQDGKAFHKTEGTINPTGTHTHLASVNCPC